MDVSFVNELLRIVGSGAVLQDPLDLITYECDALPHLRAVPAAVVLPSTAADVQAIVRLCAREGVPFVARGHGTGLSGGALPVDIEVQLRSHLARHPSLAWDDALAQIIGGQHGRDVVV